jgi:hypothetical protein
MTVAERSRWNESEAAAAALCREVFGNPFRSVSLDASWLTPDVQRLARAIYEERAFERMPILGDALEKAGCTSDGAGAALLDHCRGTHPHCRGCWCLDLLLGSQ